MVRASAISTRGILVERKRPIKTAAGKSRPVAVELLAHGGALGSQAKESTALELEARAALLQSQVDHVQAADEMDAAVGRRPQ
jgi:hypothetical protein